MGLENERSVRIYIQRNAGIALCIIFAVLSIGGCADNPVYKYYEGNTQPIDKISIIYNDTPGLIIEYINGELTRGITSWSGPEGVHEIDVLPGDYMLGGHTSEGTQKFLFNVSIHCESGKHYRLQYKPEGFKSGIAVIEVP